MNYKTLVLTPYIMYSLFSPIYENHRGFSIQFVIAKLVLKNRNYC